VWAYAWLWGWPFAVGFVLLLFVHELGHALVMRYLGLAAGAPVFVPFVGAVIAMRDRPRDAHAEALVGIGGPALGGAAALGVLAVAWLGGGPFWYALAATGLLLNLFNLLPVSPLDGGRIAGGIHRGLWVVGYAIGVPWVVLTGSPVLALMLGLGLLQLWSLWRSPVPGYYDIPPWRRAAMGLAYFGLCGVLLWGQAVAFSALP
jgi:Zn-dependent protease